MNKQTIITQLQAYGPFINDAKREALADKMLSLADQRDCPGEFVYHHSRYGTISHESVGTLDEALLLAYGDCETGEAYGLCITKDGEVIVGGDLSDRAHMLVEGK